jgi:hypothetical protein
MLVLCVLQYNKRKFKGLTQQGHQCSLFPFIANQNEGEVA